MKTINAPTVLATALVLTKVRHWADIAHGEFSALGTVVVDDGNLLITDVFLVEQTSGPGSTEMDEEGIAKLLIDLEQSGEDSGQLRCWVHSHGLSDTFWSGTDLDCIQGLDNGEWVLSWVCNKAGDDRLRLDLYQPVRLTLDHLKLKVHIDDSELRGWCAEEFAEKVDERPTALQGWRRSCRPRARQRDWRAAGLPTDPPWPHDADDGHLLVDPEDEDWWEDGWSLRDEDQLQRQLDDPWNACLALEVR